LHAADLGTDQHIDALVSENPDDLIGDVGILARGDLRSLLDDRDAAAEAPIGLRQLEADIAAAEHDQMRRQAVELQRLDVAHRLRIGEAGDVRHRRVGSDVEKHLITREAARAAVVELHLEVFRRREVPGPHDQFDTALFVCLQRHRHHAVDHGALARPHLGHVDGQGTGHRAEACAVPHQVRDFGAPDFILGRQAIDVGAGAADPPALDHCGASPGSRHVRGQEHAAIATAEDESVKPICLWHARPHLLPLKGSASVE
jgi:hypothetical protein